MGNGAWWLSGLAFAAASLLSPGSSPSGQANNSWQDATTAGSAASAQLGQWVWTRRDAALHRAANRRLPTTAATLVATVKYDGRQLVRRRGLSPSVAASDTIVIRIDDSVHSLWDDEDASRVATLLGAQLAAILVEVRGNRDRADRGAARL